jgi:NAD-dependent dihydropyrimidine dehydrogenase PreA subunit
MHTYKFDCGICLKVEQANGSNIKTLQTDWKIFTDELHTLPPGMHLMECQGCGALGIKLINPVNSKV